MLSDGVGWHHHTVTAGFDVPAQCQKDFLVIGLRLFEMRLLLILISAAAALEHLVRARGSPPPCSRSRLTWANDPFDAYIISCFGDLGLTPTIHISQAFELDMVNAGAGLTKPSPKARQRALAPSMRSDFSPPSGGQDWHCLLLFHSTWSSNMSQNSRAKGTG
ncbi:unnamed protein product [Durusdinium trenchii]|uniref:Uncharacterized protein n=2 Tax=Durusdinium trenchii TaxID=1381693 RepID=A0ABP0I4I2_9DINO